MKFTMNVLLTCILYFWDLTKQNNLLTTILTSICKQHPNFRSTFIALATLVLKEYCWWEIEKFYSDLYKADSLTPSENLLNTFLENPEIPRLTAENAQVCEGKLTVAELQLFENNESPGDDGLTAEFY